MKNNIRYEIEDNQLRIGDAFLNFDFPIQQVIEISGMLIVRLDIPSKTIYNENVFGISLEERKIKWRIMKRKYSDTQGLSSLTGVAYIL